MRITFDTTAFYDATVCDSDLMGFNSPREIVEDPVLTLERKRQLLAYWASDIHAVSGAPALRSYALGPVVTIDEILDALMALDQMVDMAAIPASRGSSVAA